MLIKFQARAITGMLVGILALSTAQADEQNPSLEKLAKIRDEISVTASEN